MASDDQNGKREEGASPDLSRRAFLRLSLAVPALSVSLLLPTTLLAASQPLWVRPLTTGKGQTPVSPPRKPKPPRLLMIDPGHGGHDPGAIGRSGTQEKDVALDIARRMADAITKERGIEARLTRDNDAFLPLPERVRIGREARADLFLSVHADSAPNPGARGLSAYTLSEKASDQFASMLADKENKVDALAGVDLPTADKDVANILFDLTARRTRNTAQRVKVGFIKSIGRNWQLLDEPMRSANFAVLRIPDVPAMLVETGFLSNKQDEAILRQPMHRQKIAVLMAKELAFLMRSSLFG